MGRRRQRREDILSRIQSTEAVFGRCAVLDCTLPTDARVGRGLNRAYCRRHAEHYRRHGSYSKPSYRAAELRPLPRGNPAVAGGEQGALGCQGSQGGHHHTVRARGAPEEVFRLAGRPPAERASKVWARLRVRQVDPSVPLAIWISVSYAIRTTTSLSESCATAWCRPAKGCIGSPGERTSAGSSTTATAS